MAGEKRLLHLQAECCAMMGGLLEPCKRGHHNTILNKGNSFKRNLEQRYMSLMEGGGAEM